VHELLLVLERNGLDRYDQPRQLLGIFDRLQRFQMACAADPNRPGYRRQPFSDPAERRKSRGERGNRRDNFLQVPGQGRGAEDSNRNGGPQQAPETKSSRENHATSQPVAHPAGG
jgi:hypothetical protein